MDTNQVEFCRSACTIASRAGWVASIDMAEGKYRVVGKNRQGKVCTGEFMGTTQEAVESWAKAFMADTSNYDTAAR